MTTSVLLKSSLAFAVGLSRLLLAYTVLATASLNDSGAREQAPRYVPNSFIVEFKSPQVENQKWESTLSSYLTHVSHRLPMEATVSQTYDSPIFRGATVQLQPASKAIMDWSLSDAGRVAITHALQAYSSVEKVTANQYIHRPLIDRDRRSVAPPERNSLAASDKDISDVARRSSHRRRDKTKIDGQLEAGASHPTHVMMGVDIQHKRGNFGQGVTVCVVGGLIDFSHPALNGGRPEGVDCLGGDCPVQGGYDFVGPKFDQVHRHPGPPKSANGCGHETLVAGVIAGRDPDGRFLGIAPEAKLWTYGIFACSFVPFNTSSGGTTEADTYAVYDRAYNDGCDVLSGSLSYYNGWQDVDSQVTSRMSRQGVTAVYSTGNEGENGPFLVGSPALGADVIAVGSVNSAKMPSWELALDPPLPDGRSSINAFTEMSWTYNRTVPQLPIRFSKAALANESIADEACHPLGDDVVGGNDYILAIFQATECGFQRQIDNVADRGVKFLLRITSPRLNDLLSYPTEPVGKNNQSVTMAMLATEDGKSLYHAYKQGSSIRATFSPKGPFAVQYDYQHSHAGLMSFFSSWGPDNEIKLFKPDFAGIGSETFGPVPLPVRYAISAGNSFSTPTVSGAVALYKSAHGRNVSTATIKRAFKHTASRVKRRGGTGDESLFWAGAGLVNVTAAIDLTIEVDPVDLVLGQDSAEFYRDIAVKNTGQRKQSFNITHQPARSVYMLQEGAPEKRTSFSSSMISSLPQDAEEAATVVIHTLTITLEPGETGVFDIRVQPPSEHPRIIMYSGFISIRSLNDTDSVANVPYTGLAGSLNSIPSMVKGVTPFDTNLPALYNAGKTEQIRNDSTVWALDPADPQSIPLVVLMTQTPSQRVVVDLVDAEIDFEATIPVIDDEDGSGNVTLNTGGPTRRSMVHQEIKSRRQVPKGTPFESVPVVGRYTDQDITGRDLYSNFLLPAGTFHSYPITSRLSHPRDSTSDYYGDSSSDFEAPEGRYRILLRVHRFHSGRLDLLENYDSYLSRAFTYRKSQGETE